MKILKNLQTLVQTLARMLPFIRQRQPDTCHHQPATQLALNLDAPTASGLVLREALPVRSAELWLQLGQPDRALEELQTLPETARQHPWPRRVSFDVAVAALRFQL
jgi:hypothetical protein